LKTRTKHLKKTQSVSQLPLFSWRVAVVQPGTRAGLHLSRQYRVRPAIADLIASLAGLGGGSMTSTKTDGLQRPLQAIREKCRDCSCYQLNEIRACETVKCASWPFRSGRHPWRAEALDANGCRRATQAQRDADREL
jgi:hypothetical protein